EPAEGGVTLLEILHNAQGVQVVVEEVALGTHGGVERLLAGVAERWMADVVHQSQRLHQVHVEPQLGRDGARNLSYLDRVRQTVAEVVGKATREYLRLGLQTSKGAGVDDPVAIALEGIAIGMWRLRTAPYARILRPHRVVSQHRTISP